MEPRILLSADPISGEFARVLHEQAHADPGERVAAIVHELAPGQGVAAAVSQAESARPSFAWAAGSSEAAEGTRVDLRAAIKDVLERAIALDEPDGGATATAAKPASDAAALVVAIEGVGPQAVGQRFVEQVLADVLEELAPDGIAGRLANLEVALADLGGDAVAELRGGTLVLDLDAGGRGWTLAADDVPVAQLPPALERGPAAPMAEVVPGAAAQAAVTSAPAPALEVAVAAGANAAAALEPAGAAPAHEHAQPAGADSVDDVQPGPVEGEPRQAFVAGPPAVQLPAAPERAGPAEPAALPAQPEPAAGLLEQLFAALAGEDASGTVGMAFLAAASRAQSRQIDTGEVRAQTSAEADDADSSGQRFVAGESDRPRSADSDRDSEPRGPPAIQSVANQDLQSGLSAWLAEGVLLPAFARQGAGPSEAEDYTARGPPARDALPRGPPATPTAANAAELPPVAVEPDRDSVAADEQATVDPTESAPIDAVAATDGGADYLLSTGTPATPSSVELTAAELDAMVTEAIARWTASGLIPVGAGALSHLTFVIADLPDDVLAAISGATVTIDPTADDFGWFVDATPDEDSEFAAPGPAGVDLLTVVMHEIGHYLGYEHGEPGLVLMSATLEVGRRFLPAFDDSMTLNQVIDAVLAIRLDPVADPNPAGFSVSSADPAVPNVMSVGRTVGTAVDLRLTGVTLTFANLAYDAVNGRWTGGAAVEATGATLFPGVSDIVITDSDADVDTFVAAGAINLAPGTAAQIRFDDLDMEQLGWPAFLEITATELVLDFSNFRVDDNLSSLSATVDLLGIDTSIPLINDLLRADNPLFGLTIEGSASTTLALNTIEAGVIAAAPADPAAALRSALRDAVVRGIDGAAGSISGNLFKIGSFEAGFIFNTVEFDPDGPGPMAARTSAYLAIEGSIVLGAKSTGNQNAGIRDKSLSIAFALAETGPLQFFIAGGGLKRFHFESGLTIEEVRLGIRFNTDLQDLQIETDFQAIDGSYDATRQETAFTIQEHDLEVGDAFRVRDAGNANYDGEFVVVAVNGDLVTADRVGDDFDPGVFAGSANITRLTIKNPLDLADEGLSSGIAPPDSILDWREQLDNAVLDQLRSGASWANLTGDVVFGGGATLSIDPIPDSVLLFDVDLIIDTDLRFLLSGTFSLFDGFVESPIKLYADLGLESDAVRFLFLWTLPEVPGFDPLLVFRGGVSFEAIGGEDVRNATVSENTAGGYWDIELEVANGMPSERFAVGDNAVVFASIPETFEGTFEVVAVDDTAGTITVRSLADPGVWAVDSTASVVNENSVNGGFRITLEGGIDLNVPGITSEGEAYTITTLTLAGGDPAVIDFRLPGPGSTSDVEMQMLFTMSLSETNIGDLGLVSGDLTVAIDADGGIVVDGVPTPRVDVWGGALLTTNFAFLEDFGLFANVSGVLLFNTSAQERGPVRLQNAAGDTIEVRVPAETFALRLDGSIGLRFDFNDDGLFSQATEQLLLIEGSFVMSFVAEEGFDVVVFRESGNPAAPLAPATATLGPNASPFLTFDVFGFLAIRSGGVAANITMSLSADAPGAFASIADVDAQFVLMLNTTGTDISFEIPAGAANPGGRSGITVNMPRAPPSSISNTNLDITSILNGNAWILPANAIGAPYLLIHAGGTNPNVDPNARLTIGPFSLVGQFSFLLGAEVDPTTLEVTPLLEIIGNFSLDISVGPLTFLQLEGGGFLRFDGNGLVAAIDFTQRAGASVPSASLGFDLSVSFRLELNTRVDGTYSFDHDDNPGTASVVVAPGFRLHMEGSLQIVSLLTLQGTFDLTIDQNGVFLAMAAYFDLLGVRADMSAQATLTSQGFTLSAELTLATPGLAVVPGLFNIQGTFLLNIDTINGTASIGIANANVNLMGLVMSGSITIGVDNGQFYIFVPAGDPLTLNFFGVATLSVSGSFNYNAATGRAAGTNAFMFTASAQLTIGVPGVLGVQARLDLSFDSARGTFVGTIDGTAWIAFISFNANATLRISGTSISLALAVTVTITPSFTIWVPFVGTVRVPAVTATYRHTFNIGNTTPPAQFEVLNPDPPVLARLDGDVLYLNMGVDAGLRDPNGDWDDEELAESFRVTHVSGGAGNETVLVDAFGFQQQYAGVARIVVTDAGLEEDVIDIAAGVRASADLNGGDGDDRISYLGSSRAILRGGAGNDNLIGGSGGTVANPDQLIGGAGNDRLTAGTGVSDVYGEDGDDTIVWNELDGATLGIVDGGADTGGDFRDSLRVVVDGAAEAAAVSAAPGGAFDVAIDGVATRASNVEGLVLDLMGAGDTATLDDLTASSLSTVIVRLGAGAAGSDGAQDRVILNGSAGAETIELETVDGDGDGVHDTVGIDYAGQVSIAIEQGDAAGGNAATGDRLTINGHGGNDVVDASGVTAQLLNIDFAFGDDGVSVIGSAFADLFDVDVIGNSAGVLNLDGRGGGDAYVVNLRGGDTDAYIAIADTGAAGGDSLVVNGTAGADLITLTNVFLRQGSNSETLTYSGLETFTVNTLGDADQVTIVSTQSIPVTVDSGDGDDVVAVQSIAGPTTIDAGTGADRVNVGSNAGAASNVGGTLNGIGAALTVVGGTESDVLDFDDTGDAAANVDGVLTATQVAGLGLATAATYSGIEDLEIHLGSGADQLVVASTHGADTAIDGNGGADTIAVRAIAGATTIDTGDGADRVNVGSNAAAASNVGGTLNGIGAALTVVGGTEQDVLDFDDTGDAAANVDGVLTATQLAGLGLAAAASYSGVEDLRIHLGSGADQFLVASTHAQATRVDGNGGADTVNVRSTALGGLTSIDTGAGDDVVNVGDAGLAGSVDGLVVIDAGADFDAINVDDSASSTGQVAVLTSDTLRGLGMAAGIDYVNDEQLDVFLGTGTDTFYVASTHAGTTRLYAGGGGDVIAVGSIGGPTTLHGQGGDDRFLANVRPSGGTPPLYGLVPANDAQFERTHGNGLDGVGGAIVLNLHGESGSDRYVVNLAGEGEALVNVRDGGVAGDGVGDLIVNGADAPGPNPNDTFLLRRDFVALLNTPVADGFAYGERVNYDRGIDGALSVNGLAGDDTFVADDNSAVTELDGGPGNDTFQIGQVFGTPRDANAGVAPGDELDTTAVIIGVIRDPGTGAVIFDPTTFAVGRDSIPAQTVQAIQAAIDDQAALGLPLDGIAYLSSGVTFETTARGGAGNDTFRVYRNVGELTLEGEDGNDAFVVRGFATLDPGAEQQADTTINGGLDPDVIEYAVNAPVYIDGGDGFDTMLVLGTPFGDELVVTANGVFGAGRSVSYVGLESVTLDALEGDDRIFVLSTAAGVVTNVIGGLGSDVIEVGGDVHPDAVVVTADPTGQDALVGEPSAQDLESIRGPLIVAGGVGDAVDQSLQRPVVLPGERGDLSAGGVLPREETEDLDVLGIFHTDNADGDEGVLYDRQASSGLPIGNPGIALTGLGMGGDVAVGGLRYGGGITMQGFEIVEILLGQGDESLDIDGTLDGAVTAVHGGGGDDTITITDRGSGPLVVYGDTSQDRARYANTSNDASASGAAFTNDGDDTIVAGAMAEQGDAYLGVLIYGGPGQDVIVGSQDDDQLAGGAGADTIGGEGGNDHIYGDSHFNVDLRLVALDRIERFDATTELDLIDAMVVVVSGGEGVGDALLSGGPGSDVLLGDHGVISQVAGTRRIETTGAIVRIATADLANGGGDTIRGGADDDFLFGGAGSDTIFGDSGSDLVFGDHGSVAGNVTAAGIGALDGAGVTNPNAAFLYTSDASAAATASAGDDTLHGGSLAALDADTGTNILLGQQGSDTIYGGGGDDDIYGGHDVAGGADGDDRIDGGAGDDVILGDNGLIERTAAATDPRFTVLQGTVIYGTNGLALVADGALVGANPTGVEARRIELFDHGNTTPAGPFGNDTIAGGADDDVIFGELGNDTLHGDGRLVAGAIVALDATIAGSDVGGDDYVEGNGGGDTIYGGLGQDDLVGGSSSLYNLGAAAARPDGADTIYGGNGALVGRNDLGLGVTDETGQVPLAEAERHARDADVILGDNGNVYRLVGTGGVDGGAFLRFYYDTYSATRQLVPRAAELLDYTPGGLDYSAAAAADVGAGDTIRGEAGDDAAYGMVGDDILFGDAQSDDLIGGYGDDWISGGTGNDGVLGDDGRIFTSRNTLNTGVRALAEPLYGIGFVTVDRNSTTLEIATPGDIQQSFVNELGELKKTVVLLPFNVDGSALQDPLYDPLDADDIIYGGAGDDFLHGGAGDDAISGAEALPAFFAAPAPLHDALGYDPVTLEFAAYDEFDPRSEMTGFLLNFAANEADGRDRIFGDLGNDWLVGGPGRDHLYGGWGDDLLSADDDLGTNGGLNDVPDTGADNEDIAFGGAGRDVLIGNTGGDRLIDWAGAFNTYLVPFAAFGAFTISRGLPPGLFEYLYDLSAADGADPFRGGDPLRNGEPDGELGLVIQKDFAWQDQTGAPTGIQPGNIPGGARDVLRGADFNTAGATDANGQINGFAADTGSWLVANGRLEVSPTVLGGDAVSVFYVDEVLPAYFEVTATINAGKPTAGSKSNAYLVFDYQSPTDFKFAGINISNDKLVMGHRTAAGWIIDKQTPAQLKPNQDYNLLLSVNGSVATLVVDNVKLFTHVYAPRLDAYGVLQGLSGGMVGLGAENSTARIDNVRVQVLPPEITFEATETFDAAPTDIAFAAGAWTLEAGALVGDGEGAGPALAAVDFEVRAAYLLGAAVTVQTAGAAGLFFDRNGEGSYKFAVLSVATGQLLVGHYTARDGIVVDRAAALGLSANAHELKITLSGTTVSVVVDGSTVLGHAFNANVVDGDIGLLTLGAQARFDALTYMTDDPQYLAVVGEGLSAASASVASFAPPALDAREVLAMAEAVLGAWLADGTIDLAQYARLEALRWYVTDLPGELLGLATARAVYIDATAAAFGWYVDRTPAQDAEFAHDGRALPGSGAELVIDLKTVVAHELGHVLGLEHGTEPWMRDSLAAGVRLTSTSLEDGDEAPGLTAETGAAAASPVVGASAIVAASPTSEDATWRRGQRAGAPDTAAATMTDGSGPYAFAFFAASARPGSLLEHSSAAHTPHHFDDLGEPARARRPPVELLAADAFAELAALPASPSPSHLGRVAFLASSGGPLDFARPLPRAGLGVA